MNRLVRALAPLALSLAVLGVAAPPARAEAPQQKTQVPGYYRQMVGAFEVTALYDGQIMLDQKLLKNASATDIQKLLARQFRVSPTPTAVIAFLINTGERLVLVDAGAGRFFGPTLGQVVPSLKAAGYQPEQVDVVLLTHLHGDHVGGLVQDGQAVFPRATVFASAGDAAHWLSPEVASRAPEGAQRFFQMARDGVAPYVQADRFKTFTGDAEILPGIAPVLSHGHTPGHTSYLLRSRGQQLLVWGDIVHNAAVQFPRPTVTIEFDSDSRQALATRLKLLGWTARDALMVAGAHLPFPGLGQVRAEGKGRFAWVPLDYAPVAP
ncbi:MBL fold metallo-hydrolase [Aquabacterium sp.]|uniref:MBL fold metallo-hydrolase n=1 Tax=Aquabacterium sp. TaxID=1872578 RepID=UPI0035C77178